MQAERLSTDRLTRVTRALVSATGVLALATIALVLVTLTQLCDGQGGTKRSTRIPPGRSLRICRLAAAEFDALETGLVADVELRPGASASH